MGQVIKPIQYEPLLDMKQTEQGIKLIKDFFQQNLSTELRLRRNIPHQGSGRRKGWSGSFAGQVEATFAGRV